MITFLLIAGIYVAGLITGWTARSIRAERAENDGAPEL